VGLDGYTLSSLTLWRKVFFLFRSTPTAVFFKKKRACRAAPEQRASPKNAESL